MGRGKAKPRLRVCLLTWTLATRENGVVGKARNGLCSPEAALDRDNQIQPEVLSFCEFSTITRAWQGMVYPRYLSFLIRKSSAKELFAVVEN